MNVIVLLLKFQKKLYVTYSWKMWYIHTRDIMFTLYFAMEHSCKSSLSNFCRCFEGFTYGVVEGCFFRLRSEEERETHAATSDTDRLTGWIMTYWKAIWMAIWMANNVAVLPFTEVSPPRSLPCFEFRWVRCSRPNRRISASSASRERLMDSGVFTRYSYTRGRWRRTTAVTSLSSFRIPRASSFAGCRCVSRFSTE